MGNTSHIIKDGVEKKWCSNCKEYKELFEFSKNKSKKDGLSCWCKICMKEHHDNYYEKNKEEILVQQKEYYEENKEEILEKQKEYKKEHEKEIAEYKKEYYEKK